MAVTGRMLIRWRRKTRAWSRSAFDWQGPCACDDLCQLSAAVLLKQSGILLSEAHWTSCVSSFSLFPHHHPHPPTSLYMLVRWCFILFLSSSAFFPSVCQDPWLTGSSDFLTLPLSVIINALAPLVACVILDIRAALWRVDGWGGGVCSRKEWREERMDDRWIRKGWMRTSCCNLFAFSAAIGAQFPLFPLPASLRLASRSLSVRAISLILTCVSLTFFLWHHTSQYSIAQYAWERDVPWFLHIYTHDTPLGRRRAKSGVHITTRLLVQWEQSWSKTVKTLQIVPPLLISKRYHPHVSWMHCFTRICCAHARLIVHDC